jgi:hypothetical protein
MYLHRVPYQNLYSPCSALAWKPWDRKIDQVTTVQALPNQRKEYVVCLQLALATLTCLAAPQDRRPDSRRGDSASNNYGYPTPQRGFTGRVYHPILRSAFYDPPKKADALTIESSILGLKNST